MYMLYIKTRLAKLLKNERGEANIIAIILVLAIVIALAIVFRSAIKELFDKVWDGLFNEVDNVSGQYPDSISPT